MSFRILPFLLCLSISSVAAAKDLKIAMGSKLPPMHFYDGAGNFVGFEVDLVRMFADEQQSRAVFLDPGQYKSSSLDLVLSGKADMAVNCIAITEERKHLADFSDPYFDSGAAFLSRADSPATVDFYRRSYVTVRNSLYAKILEEKSLRIWKEVASTDEGLALLNNEKLPKHRPITLVYDWTALQRIAEENKELKLAGFLISHETYGAAFKRGVSMAAWNAFLKRIRLDGRHAQLLQKWFKDKTTPSLATIPDHEYRSGLNDRPEHLELELLPGGKVAEYLPTLNAEPTAKISNVYYDYLVKHYNKKWLPHLEELFQKDSKVYPGLQDKFYSLIRDKNILEMLPFFYQTLDISASPKRPNKTDRFLVEMATKHPGLRSDIVKAYDTIPRSLHLRYSPGCAGENGSRVAITVQPDKKGEATRTITASMGTDAALTILPSAPGGPTRITINGITGTLKEMTLSGDHTVSIISLEKGYVASVGLPDNVEYSGMSSDGKTMYLNLGRLRLSFNVEAKKIFMIEPVNPLAGRKFDAPACDKPEGLDYFQTATSNKGEIYYLGLNTGGDVSTTVYKQDTSSCKTIRQAQFLGSAAKPVIMDDKLFTSDVGYDLCAPYNVVDLESGLKLDTGSCAGIVQVGPHDLLYCAGGGWVINTETLQRRKVNAKGCPGKTGELLPHPLPGHYISISWTLC